MVYGLFMLVAGGAAMFFLFNTGQLTAEKTRLVNTADAVAYSAGVLHARALNTTAYLNRALLAQEVLVAQTVSLQSWAQLMSDRAQTLTRVNFPECRDPTGRAQAASALFRFGLDYAVMCSVMNLPGVAPAVVTGAEAIEAAGRAAIVAAEVDKASLMAAQALLHAPGVFEALRADTLQQVADRNHLGAGRVRVESGPLTPGGLLLTDGWRGAVQGYAGAERDRFAEVARAAAAADPFVRERSWESRGLLPMPNCPLDLGDRSEVRRRGGTELVDFDTWRAIDTESWYLLVRRRAWSLRCQHREIVPIGGGLSEAGARAGDPAEPDDGLRRLRPADELPGHHGRAAENRLSYNRALADRGASTRNTAYSGLPRFHDLSLSRLRQADGDPRIDFAVRVVRERDQIEVSDGRSAIRSTDRINAYRSELAGGEMSAVAAAQVYFQRPVEHRRNGFGDRSLGGRSDELASLFNPWWQVRLVDASADASAQRIRQAGGF